MPELTPLLIALLAVMLVVGAVVGWILRGNRSQHEKAAVSAGWQQQLEAQRVEHDRLTEQNKVLMEQVSQYQASNRDAKNRSRELSEAVQDAFARRDELQRELKEIRTNLERAVTERNQLQSNIADSSNTTAELDQKSARIQKLEAELKNWQDRVPPLIERFRERNTEAQQLEADLDAARARIRELEAMIAHGETRVDPVESPASLTDGLDASNDTIQVEASIIEESVILEAPEEEEEEDEEIDEDVARMNGASDDLQQIKGIGPAIEKTLNELGIFRFDQIADMSEYDIDRVANRLRGFRSRIYREDWIGQARELRDQQPGA